MITPTIIAKLRKLIEKAEPFKFRSDFVQERWDLMAAATDILPELLDAYETVCAERDKCKSAFIDDLSSSITKKIKQIVKERKMTYSKEFDEDE